MRVISGIYKRRRFDVPRTFKARPTTDFAKENLFNVLANYLDFEDGVSALDLFAGTGKELTIKALTELVAKVVGFTGEIKWDTSRPNGTPRKLLDVSKATALGWSYQTELEDGIRLAYDDFLHNPMRAER